MKLTQENLIFLNTLFEEKINYVTKKDFNKYFVQNLFKMSVYEKFLNDKKLNVYELAEMDRKLTELSFKVTKGEPIDKMDRKIINKELKRVENTSNLQLMLGAGWGAAGTVAMSVNPALGAVGIVPGAILIIISLTSKRLVNEFRKLVETNGKTLDSKNSKINTMFIKAGNDKEMTKEELKIAKNELGKLDEKIGKLIKGGGLTALGGGGLLAAGIAAGEPDVVNPLAITGAAGLLVGGGIAAGGLGLKYLNNRLKNRINKTNFNDKSRL